MSQCELYVTVVYVTVVNVTVVNVTVVYVTVVYVTVLWSRLCEVDTPNTVDEASCNIIKNISILEGNNKAGNFLYVM